MFTLLLTLSLLLPEGYFAAYSGNAQDAMEFYRENKSLFDRHFQGASAEEKKMAFAIVAPEVSCYDVFMDFVETEAMKHKYVDSGECDYSIGYFQMKPSFVESLENEVFRSSALRAKYGAALSYSREGSATDKRRERLNRLCQTEWQVRYLAIFLEIVKARTAGWGLAGNEERLRYWATMYNAGFYLSKARVRQRQSVKQFPRSTNEFNYSAVAVEFYKML